MRFAKVAFVFALSLALVTCSKKDSATTPPDGPSLPAISGDNVMKLTVNGSTCGSANYQNKPCVSVTICAPAGSPCQTVNDILLDTGSTGLRIFKSLLTVTLTPVTVGGRALAECAQFGDGSYDWGPVMTASLVLGNEPGVQVPVQVIDASYVGQTGSCSKPGKLPDQSPSDAKLNGILGLGLFKQDCGNDCATTLANHLYFSCDGSGCTQATVPTAQQVTNPVSALPTDNNGVLIELPSLPSGAAYNAGGWVVLGIGTRTNNVVPSTAKVLPTDANGQYRATFQGVTYNLAFTDTGSNGYFFPASGFPDCPNYSGFYCPTTVTSLAVDTTGNGGSPTVSVPFQISSFSDLAGSTNNVSSQIGGSASSLFDLGLPFFFGKTVAVGIETTTATINSATATGPYWAY